MFISRLVRGGLAESTGLLGVNDEILEVNGIDVAGKSLDQVNTGPPNPDQMGSRATPIRCDRFQISLNN